MKLQRFLIALLVGIAVLHGSGEKILGQAAPLNTESLKNMEYPVVTWQGTEKVKLINGKFNRTGKSYINVEIKKILFGDFNHDGVEEALVICEYSEASQRIRNVLNVVMNRNEIPVVTDYKHFYGNVKSLDFNNGVIQVTVITSKSKLPKDRQVTVIEYLLEGNKLIEK